jgi:uncharacterized protein DUF5916/cellulose/xylan binding protein with CBM9 domain
LSLPREINFKFGEIRAVIKSAIFTLIVIVLAVAPLSAQPAPSPAASGSPSAATKSAPSGGKPAFVIPPEKAQPVRMPKFEKAPTIDGKLDDEIWKSAAVLKDFYQTQPGDNTAPTKPTEVFLGYDAKFLYVAFHCYDEPDKVRATLSKRDNIWNDDYVGILFDTFNDGRKAYEFDFNPFGIQADGIWTDGQGEDFNPDIVMESKGVITNDGWTVEVAIPFKSLRYVAGKDKLWGAHFWRRIKRANNELSMWMPMNRDISSWLAQEGHLSGLEGISTERTLELIPSLTLSETGKRKPSFSPVAAGQLDPGRMVNEPIKFDPGLTGKYSITPNVTLDFAINPDFAQVESDQLVVTANQRFPIFYPEKRPFFLEGIDIFSSQIAAVHTRAIIDPDVAVKLTGKVDRNTFGLLVASDNGPGNFSPEERLTANPRFFDKNASIGILRLKHDIGKKDSFVGFLGTAYKFVDRYNYLGGLDGRQRIDKQTTFMWQFLATRTRRFFFDPDAGRSIDSPRNAFIYAVNLDKSGRHFGYNVSGVGRTLYYRADVGFNRRANSNNYNVFTRYNSEPKPKARLISWRVYNAFGTSFDWQGRSQNFNNESQLQLSFPRQTYFGVGMDHGYERVLEEEFGPRRGTTNCVVTNNCTFFGPDNERSSPNRGVYFFAGSTLSKKYGFEMFGNRRWNDFDFDFGAGPKFPRVSPAALLLGQGAPLDPGPGSFFHYDVRFNWVPISALNASLSYSRDKLRRNDTGRVAFNSNIVSLRATYQFSRFVFARGRVDYDSIAENYKAQFLFGWTPNPGTAFYVGYNDDLNRNGYSPFTGQLEPGFRRNGRTVFIKMSYLFRKSFG